MKRIQKMSSEESIQKANTLKYIKSRYPKGNFLDNAFRKPIFQKLNFSYFKAQMSSKKKSSQNGYSITKDVYYQNFFLIQMMTKVFVTVLYETRDLFFKKNLLLNED